MKRFAVLVLTVFLFVGLFGCVQDDIGYNPDEYVTLGQYTGIELAEQELTINEEALAEAILQDRYSLAVTTTVSDRPIQEGDTVKVLYDLIVDGESVDGHGELYTLTVGEGACPFEEELIGHSAGDKFSVQKTVEDEALRDYIGKDGTYDVEVEEILHIDTPEADEEFARDMGYDSLEEYIAAMEEAQLAALKENARTQGGQELLAKAVENAEIKSVPGERLNEIKLRLEQHYDTLAAQFGVDAQMYAAAMLGITADQVDAELEKQAREQVEEELVIRAIAKKEGITYSDEQYEEFVLSLIQQIGLQDRRQFAEAMGIEFEEMYDKEVIQEELLKKLVCDYLYDNSVITE